MAIFPSFFRRRGFRRPAGPLKVHVGAGRMSLHGWINVDNQPLPGIDHVMDVTRRFPFDDVAFIFAEHFIEHLAYDDALRFLKRCRTSTGSG
jgi:predicted SAM-dependent methyltransferase